MLPYLSRTATTTITDLRLYIENRFREYEMLSSVLGRASKPKEPKNPRLNDSGILSNAAATAGLGAEGGQGGGELAGRGGEEAAGGEGAAADEGDGPAAAGGPTSAAQTATIRAGARHSTHAILCG